MQRTQQRRSRSGAWWPAARLALGVAERTSGEAELPELQPLPPPPPAAFVDVATFPGELHGRRADVADATQAALRAMPGGDGEVSEPPSSVLESFRFLGGRQCEASIGIYCDVAELDARAGDARFRSWEQHDGLRHAAYVRLRPCCRAARC